jgi:hypothetical protein
LVDSGVEDGLHPNKARHATKDKISFFMIYYGLG